MLISSLLIFIIFISYIFLIIKSFKEEQINNYKTIISYLRISIDLFRTILYLPLIEIFMTVIVCDVDYFKNNIQCWKSEHIIYVFLSSLSLLLLILLSCLFTSVSFNKRENFSSNVSKYLIINSDIIILISRSFDIILLEICILKEIFNFAIIFLFFSSLISAFCIFIERKYQNSKINIIINVKYILNMFFFVNCFMLFIANLIKQKNFKGIFIIFLVISIVILIYSYSFSYIQFNIFKRPLKRDRDIYNNIRNIIQLVENKYKNRQYLLKLLSYSFNLSHSEQLTKIKNLTPLKKIVELYNNEIDDDKRKKLEVYIYQYIEGLFKDALKIFRDSPLLLINYSIFQLEKMHRYHKAYIILLKCINLPNLNFSQEFFLYRIKRNLEEKGGELGKEQSYISYCYQINNMASLISDVSFSYTQLYGILLNNTKMNINNLKEIAIKIDNLNNKIHNRYKILESYGFINKKVVILYNNFLKDILYDTSKISDNINEEELSDDMKINTNYFNINSLITQSNFQFLIASGESQNFGKIIKISLELCELLGYSDKDVIGQNINIFIPNMLRIPHENLLREKVKNVTLIEDDFDKMLKLVPVYFKASSKLLIPINLKVGIYYDENNQLIIFCKLIKSNNQYLNKCIVMINNSLIIQSFSSNATLLLGLDSSIINENIDITNYFIEFYKECLNYFSTQNIKNKNILSTKLKLIKEYFLSNSENKIITWKNHKQFKIEWKEINIDDKTYGYSIFFEPIKLNENDRKIYIEEMLSPRKIKTKSSKKNHIFPNINYNYIPEIEQKINFNINSKSYVINEDNSNFESIQQFFENKYKSIERKRTKHVDFQIKKLNDSSFEESESSGYEDVSYESCSFIEEEEEEKKENIIINEEKPKEIIIEKSNDNYYEVNLKKVILQLYDFKSNIIQDCKDYIIQSKMKEIFNHEEEISKNKINKKFSKKYKNNNTKNKLKFSLIHFEPEINENDNLIINSILEKLINKITSPKLINKNILYYLIVYIFQFFSILFISIILFDMLIRYIDEIFSLFEINYNQCNIIGHIGLIQFYSNEYILLKNPNYNNIYQVNRTQYRLSIIMFLNILYEKCMEEVKFFDCIEDNFEKKEQLKLKNLKANFTIYYKINEYYLHPSIITLSPDNAIKEYLFSLYKIINSEINELNFLNINLNYIQTNTNQLAEILKIKSDIYINCIHLLISHVKFISWVIFALHILIYIISFFLSLYIKSKIIKEKEKYLEMFYKIDHEIIKFMLLKCEKYTKIQIDKDNPMSNSIFEIIQDDNEIDSLIDNKGNTENNYFKEEIYENQRNIKKKENIMKNKEFKKSFILEGLFLIILSSILLILILILNNSYKYYELICKINHYIILEGKYIFVALNTIRTAILYSTIFYIYPNSLEQFTELIPTISLNYSIVKKIELDIHAISLKYKFPGNTSSILSQYSSESYCKFLYNFSQLNNISCEKFADNISNFGLPTIQAYFFNNIIQAAYSLKSLIEESINNGNFYYDYYYGTPLYVNIYDDKEYAIKNPFLMINNEGMKDSNIIMTTLIYPKFQNLIVIIYENMSEYTKKLKNLTIIFIVIYACVIILTYIFCIFPLIFKENEDLNKTKTVLKVIPRIILNDIIKTEYLNDTESVK